MAAGVVRQRITGMRILVIRGYLRRSPANRVWPWKPGETFRYLTGFTTTQSEIIIRYSTAQGRRHGRLDFESQRVQGKHS